MYDLFSLPDFKMPEGFLWGSGYAGHQVEGNNIHSQRWAREQAGGTLEKSGIACDSYRRYAEDAELVRALGHQAFRTSVEWARIEPEEGVFNEEAIEHYVRFFALLKEKGVQVFATMIHVTYPQWLEEKGGLTNRENLRYFERFLRRVVPRIAPYVSYWNVLNETNIQSAPTKLSSLAYHALGYHVIHEYSKRPVSSAHALMEYTPLRAYDRFDQITAQMEDWKCNEFYFHALRTGEVVYPGYDVAYIPDLKDALDYWSINFYVREMEDSRRREPECSRYRHKLLKMIDMDFYLEEMHPEGMISSLLRLDRHLPIYITENGCSCDDDRFRIVFLSLYLCAIKEAMDLGADVRGYLQWTLLDNYEWTSFAPKFGMVAVDRETCERTVKPSAYFYRDCIEHNGLSQEIIRRYLDQMPSLAK